MVQWELQMSKFTQKLDVVKLFENLDKADIVIERLDETLQKRAHCGRGSPSHQGEIKQ